MPGQKNQTREAVMKKGLVMTPEQVRTHQARHGFGDPLAGGATTAGDIGKPRAGQPGAFVLPKSRMNKCETEFSLILEARKRKHEIVDWKFEGMSLSWGADPATGKAMRYTGDFWVYRNPTFEDSEYLSVRLPITIIEVKGPRIIYSQQAMARFKGCRAEWPMFRFEMHQKKQGQWTRIQ